MPSKPDPATSGTMPDEFVRRRLEAIDGTLSAGFGEDTRLQNGVPQRDRASDLDFIQMSGLTRGNTAMPNAPVSGGRPLDADAPLSFYESGVMDVDARARSGRGRDQARHQPEQDVALGSPPKSSSADALRALVEEFTREGIAPDEEVEDIAEDATGIEPSDDTPPALDLDPETLSAVIDAWVEETPSPSLSPPPAAAVSHEEEKEEEDFDSLLAAFELPEAEPVSPASDNLDLPDGGASDTEPQAGAPTEDPLSTLHADDADDIMREAEALFAAVSTQPFDEEIEAIDAQPVEAPAEPITPYSFATPPPHTYDANLYGKSDAAASDVDEEALPEGEFDYGMVTGRRHYGRHFARRSRRIKRMLALVVLLVLPSIAGVVAYQSMLRPAVLGPERLWREANAAVAHGAFSAGSQQFAQYAERFPNDALRAEALFNAAFYRQLPEDAGTVSSKRLEEAADLFARYLREHPGDARVDRAQVLLGITQFNLKHYDEAIRLLRESAKALNDPTAALPVLRTLASAYRMQGQYRDAESTYLQAASLPKNFAPDADYFELGDMLRGEAALEEDPEQRAALRTRAADYWQRAMDSPAIDPVEREKIQTLMEWLNKEVAGPAAEATGPQATGAPAAVTPEPSTAAAPAAAGTEWEPDPAQEAAYLENNAGTPGLVGTDAEAPEGK